ncbi:hypothetical protein PU629_14135 [Pullulanibacillus sp. KACC 23026]|nr:hypothetical protein [Pullulanibacillus sp. KACC 23026]WEG11299.1 hypothetical protein PU629_14135 [Pullulanibacillus sp. KACC 23026]
MDHEAKNYDEKLTEQIAYAERNTSDNIPTDNGLNREEGKKKKNQIDS